MRAAAKEMVGINLAAESAPFPFPLKSGGLEVRAAPYVYVPNLETKLLEKNER